MISVKKFVRSARQNREDRLYHEKSNKSAIRTLGYLERQKGPLKASIKKDCDDYAVGVLGDVRYAPWLYVYSIVAGQFSEGWLPSNYWGRVIVPKIQGVHGRVSELKSMNQIIFKSDLFPDLLSYVNGIFSNDTGKVFSPDEAEKFLFSSSSRVIFKPDQARQGLGIQIFRSEEFDAHRFKRSFKGSGVFQKFIDQDNTLASFCPSAVATLRLNTAINERGVSELRSAHLRLGTGTDIHVKNTSQIRVPVCLSTGSLYDAGYTSEWLEIGCHPDSDVKFSGFKFPMFKEAVIAVNRLQETIPFVKCIGWDVCVDSTGKVNIMEWNGRQNGIQFPEATQGPCFVGLGW